MNTDDVCLNHGMHDCDICFAVSKPRLDEHPIAGRQPEQSEGEQS